jgi:hypothetical protein
MNDNIRGDSDVLCRTVRPGVSSKLENGAVTKFQNRCANCGGKFGLVCYHHWGMRFCRMSCKDAFLVKAARDHARIRKWFGFSTRRTSRS